MDKTLKQLKKENKELEKELERLVAQRKFLSNLKTLFGDIKDA